MSSETEQFNAKKEFAEHFDKYGSNRDQWRRRAAYYHLHIEKFLHYIIPKGSKVLELGCSQGDTLSNLEPAKGVGVDISSQMIESARKRHPELEFFNADIYDFELKETFDYVLIISVLGFLEDIQLSLVNVQKVCSAESRVVIVYYNLFWRPILGLAELIGLRMPSKEWHWLPPHDAENLLFLAGFETVRRENRVLIPYYIPIVSSLFNKYLIHLPLIGQFALNYILVVKPILKRKNTEDASVSVVIPCRNEKGNIENAIKRLPKMGKHTEIIFIEGNSQDGTFEECIRVKEKYSGFDIRVYKQDSVGKRDAVQKGLDLASGDILMILDADLTVPPEDLPKFYEALVTGKGEFINGSRLVYNMEPGAMMMLNTMANKFFGWVFSILLSQKIRDTLCGTKVFWKKDYEKIKQGRTYFGDFDPFGDFDLLFGASKLSLKIIEIPIRYKARKYGETQISRFRHGLILLRMVIYAFGKIKFF
jgi:ubiquinone/menaquinone biosynthesis C-methylase UbiE